MERQILEEILGSGSLPSLPGVAVQVLELTSNPDVSLDELAGLIRNDQALAAKVLQTVNSSFYGLRTRCASIQKALGLLGLNPVKSLVLGFSLVAAVDDKDDEDFDYRDYWRRSLHAALGARAMAEVKELENTEEIFLAAMFQDVGMIAMRRALGQQYLDVLVQADGDHAKLPMLELEAFETTHAAVGALLAEHWRLPGELSLPVRYHTSPTAAPKECSLVVRCVGLGGMVHDLLDAAEPALHLRRLYDRAQSWLAMSNAEVDHAVARVGEWAREAAKLFSVDAGGAPDAEAVLRKAERQMIKMRQDGEHESYAERNLESVVAGAQERDALTGALGRDGFVAAVREGAPVAVVGNAPITIMQLVIEGLDTVTAEFGAEARDEVMLGVVAQLHSLCEPMGGIVCRLSESIVGVVMPGTARAAAVLAAERFRGRFTESAPHWIGLAEGTPCPARVSVGVASIDADSAHVLRDADALLVAAREAVREARTAEGSRVCAFAPAA